MYPAKIADEHLQLLEEDVKETLTKLVPLVGKRTVGANMEGTLLCLKLLQILELYEIELEDQEFDSWLRNKFKKDNFLFLPGFLARSKFATT